VQVADGSRPAYASLSAQLPRSVEREHALDRSVSIHQSVNDVQVTLLVTRASW